MLALLRLVFCALLICAFADLVVAAADENKALSDAISSADPASVRRATAQIRTALTDPSPQTLSALRNAWLPKLMKAGRFDDVAELARLAIAAKPHDTANVVEPMQQLRVKALLGAGKNTQALAAARSLYNVASMVGTFNGINAVSDALAASGSSGARAAIQFRAQQLMWAQPPDGDVSSPIKHDDGVLGNILAEGETYRPLAMQLRAGRRDFTTLMGLGNVLLLCGQMTEARDVFTAAYQLAPASQLQEATEAFARCIRAEDGAIGRANAWAQSMRPKG